MSLTALKRDLANIKQFRTTAAIAKHSDPSAPTRGTATLYNLGEIRDARLRWTPINTAKSTSGKTHQVGAEIELSFVMMQTSDTEVAAIQEIARENDFGSSFKFTDKTCSGGDAQLSAAAGFWVENAGVNVEGDFDLSGGESGITVTLTGEVDMATLAAFGNRGLGGDYTADERKLTFDAC